MTTARGVLLTVTVADCVPVYLAVPDRGRGAAARGMARHGRAASCGRGVERLLAATGAAPARYS